MMIFIKISSICCIILTLFHGFHAVKNKKSATSKLDNIKRLTTDNSKKPKPNVIFIFADDLGFSDVGYNGRQYGSGVKTPNIDKLASKGVILNNYYVQPICSPTRSQLMTGRYQIHTGLQHSNIPPTRPFCLPLDEVTLPQKLKESGYATHMIGKWHLGFQRKECLPTSRGFDSFLGMYLGSGDYFSHIKAWEGMAGFDFHRDTKYNQTTGFKYYGEYSTHVFANRARGIIKSHSKKYAKNKKPFFMYLSFQAPHGPLQVPSRYKLPFHNTTVTGDRRTLAAMIYCMDEAIGDVVKELKRTDIYENTVIIFSSDNGGAQEIPASNWPLRGSKGTYWEGGVRGVGFINSPLLPKTVKRTISNAFVHVSDWFPTIVSGIAGGNLNGTKPLDGYDVWNAITSGTASPRTEILHNINPVFRKLDVPLHQHGTQSFDPGTKACLRMGDWKILTGSQWSPKKPESEGISKWFAPPESEFKSIERRDPKGKHIWLFNIPTDPYELNDVSESNPDVVKRMLARLQEYGETMVTPVWPRIDNKYTPADYGEVWGPWKPSEIIEYKEKKDKKDNKSIKKQQIKEKKEKQDMPANQTKSNKGAKKKKIKKNNKDTRKEKEDELQEPNVGIKPPLKSKHVKLQLQLHLNSRTTGTDKINAKHKKKGKRKKKKKKNKNKRLGFRDESKQLLEETEI